MRQRQHTPDARLAEALRGRCCRCRCRRGGSGRSTASGRRRRTARRAAAAPAASPADSPGVAADATSVASASQNTISAWTGSVSWNSSTSRCRYFCCSARAHADVLAQHAGREVEQVAVVERVQPAPLVAAACRARGSAGDRQPIDVLAPLREIRLDDVGAEVARAAARSGRAGASSRPASPPTTSG